MSRDSSTVDGATKVLNVSEDTRRDDADRSVVDGTSSSGTPDGTVTKTLRNGTTTTVPGTPAVGSAASTSIRQLGPGLRARLSGLSLC